MARLRVAFQGVDGAYSAEAARSCFAGTEIELCPYPRFTDVCDAVARGETVYGILPVANSQTGPIAEMEQLLQRYPLTVVRSIDFPVRHCLLCLPGQQLHDLVMVVSHPQALEQCSVYLESLGVQVVPMENTAEGAKMIATKQLRGFAAIASARAAEIYRLQILATDIQNTPDNTTRFSIIQKNPLAIPG
uniref:prephenate dehydratase n=1 Tax=Thermosporothrix sp. COM3 TaxID=2490863 RepID=A0A455SH46_9CHLR|nr:hypothetical protein KTC_25380 [Thermosporothrix sp. COM3]